MHNLLDFLRKYNYVFLFLLLEIASFVLLFRFNNFQGSVWFTSANAVVASINGVYGDVMAYLNLQTVNRDLTQRNIVLQQQVEQLRLALDRAGHDSTYTEQRIAEILSDYQMIPARVVSNTSRGTNNYLVIDQGEKQGVRPEMGVVGGGGVVGIVYLVEANHSLVIPVTNNKSSISCRVRGQNYHGFLQWDGGSFRRAHVDDVPRYAEAKVGEVIETSGYSSMFPPGIFVGRVRKVSNSPDGQSYRLEVSLGTDFSNIRDVSVIATPHKAEVDSLYHRADLNMPAE